MIDLNYNFMRIENNSSHLIKYTIQKLARRELESISLLNHNLDFTKI